MIKKRVFLAILFFSLVSFSLSADENRNSRKNHKKTYSLSKGVLTEIHPDIVVVNEKAFFRSTYVQFFRINKRGEKIRISEREITLPSLVDMVYHTYSRRTESTPYHKGDKVVVKLVVLFKKPSSIIE